MVTFPLLVVADPIHFSKHLGPVVTVEKGNWEVYSPDNCKVGIVVDGPPDIIYHVDEEKNHYKFTRTTKVRATVIDPMDAKEVTVFIRSLPSGN